VSQNPEAVIIAKLKPSISKVLKKLGLKGDLPIQEVTKKTSFGDFSSPVFQIAKLNKRNPMELAKEIAENFPAVPVISEITAEGGFVNYTLNRSYCSRHYLETILSNEDFFFGDIYKGQKIIVEHTSANPNGPIHIGNFRGSIIGDTFARLLKTVGAVVETHFYVDDLGHQIPVVVIGYELLKKYNKVKSTIKVDHYLGQIYGITHTIYDVQKLKLELKEKYDIKLGKSEYWLEQDELDIMKNKLSKENIPKEDLVQHIKRFEFLISIQTDIYKRFKVLYDSLMSCIKQEKMDLVNAIPDLNRRYMEQEKEAVTQVRGVCEIALSGHKEELALLGITHDNYDWEADLQWSGKVDIALKKLEENGYIIADGKARLFESNKAADLEGAREHLNLKKSYEVPNAIVITSTGDTLYLLRDIAYSVEKVDHFNSDKVYNVIGKPQELTQKQLNLALRAIDRKDAADKTWHVNYEYMELKGALTRMSARRLQYITPKEILEQTKQAVLTSFLEERDYPKKEKEEIAKIVAVGAIKYAIIAIGLMKKLIFNPIEVVSLNNNTSTFIQYAFARSQNILAKTDFKWKKEYSKLLENLKENEEWNLILELGKLPRVVEQAAKQIKPELMCYYLFDVATYFNKFYDKHRVIDAPTKDLETARLALTYTTGVILSKGLQLLGIESPKRM